MKNSERWRLFEQLVCSKACDIIAEDAFSVASQHSSVLFFWSAGNMWQELKGRYSWISQLRLEDLKTVTFYLWTLQEDRARHKVTLSFWTFPELLAFLAVMTSSELLSCSQGADMWIPNLFPVRSPRLLLHPLNWKSPHHARKCAFHQLWKRRHCWVFGPLPQGSSQLCLKNTAWNEDVQIYPKRDLYLLWWK